MKYTPGQSIDSVQQIQNSGTAATLPDSLADQGSVWLLTGNVTFTMPTPAIGKWCFIYVKQDATGSRTVTFTGVKWPGGSAPTASTAAGAIDRYDFECPDGVTWYGVISGQAFA